MKYINSKAVMIILILCLFTIGSCKYNDPVLEKYYLDSDQDGYGNGDESTSIMSSVPVTGYALASNGFDCDDADNAIYPGQGCP